ncbi:TPA: glycosyltransferase [Photobacterium damselae]
MIALLIPKLTVGGAERLVIDTAINLNKRGISTCLITFNSSFEYDIDDIENLYVVKNIYELRKLLIKLKVKYCISYMARANMYALLATLFTNIEPVLTIHAAIEYGLKVRTKLNKLFTIGTYRLAKLLDIKFICVSKGISKELKTLYGIDNSFTLNNFVPSNIIINKSKEIDIAKSTTKIRFCFFGRLVRTKGADIIIKAIKSLPRDVLNQLEFHIFGDGVELNSLKSEVERNNLNSIVSFFGSVNNPYPYMKACDFVIIPSRSEGFGLVVLEALLLGSNIIFSKCEHEPKNIINDYFPHLNDFGFTNPNEDEGRAVKELKNIILSAIKERDYISSYQEINKNIVCNEFSDEQYIKNLLKIIKSN